MAHHLAAFRVALNFDLLGVKYIAVSHESESTLLPRVVWPDAGRLTKLIHSSPPIILFGHQTLFCTCLSTKGEKLAQAVY